MEVFRPILVLLVCFVCTTTPKSLPTFTSHHNKGNVSLDASSDAVTGVAKDEVLGNELFQRTLGSAFLKVNSIHAARRRRQIIDILSKRQVPRVTRADPATMQQQQGAPRVRRIGGTIDLLLLPPQSVAYIAPGNMVKLDPRSQQPPGGLMKFDSAPQAYATRQRGIARPALHGEDTCCASERQNFCCSTGRARYGGATIQSCCVIDNTQLCCSNNQKLTDIYKSNTKTNDRNPNLNPPADMVRKLLEQSGKELQRYESHFPTANSRFKPSLLSRALESGMIAELRVPFGKGGVKYGSLNGSSGLFLSDEVLTGDTYGGMIGRDKKTIAGKSGNSVVLPIVGANQGPAAKHASTKTIKGYRPADSSSNHEKGAVANDLLTNPEKELVAVARYCNKRYSRTSQSSGGSNFIVGGVSPSKDHNKRKTSEWSDLQDSSSHESYLNCLHSFTSPVVTDQWYRNRDEKTQSKSTNTANVKQHQPTSVRIKPVTFSQENMFHPPDVSPVAPPRPPVTFTQTSTFHPPDVSPVAPAPAPAPAEPNSILDEIENEIRQPCSLEYGCSHRAPVRSPIVTDPVSLLGQFARTTASQNQAFMPIPNIYTTVPLQSPLFYQKPPLTRTPRRHHKHHKHSHKTKKHKEGRKKKSTKKNGGEKGKKSKKAKKKNHHDKRSQINHSHKTHVNPKHRKKTKKTHHHHHHHISSAPAHVKTTKGSHVKTTKNSHSHATKKTHGKGTTHHKKGAEKSPKEIISDAERDLMQENAGLFQKWLQMNTAFFNSNGKIKKDYSEILKKTLKGDPKIPMIKRNNIPLKKSKKHAKTSHKHAKAYNKHDHGKHKKHKKNLRILHKKTHAKGKLYYVELGGKKMKILLKKRKPKKKT